MTHNNEWSELSDSYAEHTPRIVGEVIRPSRPLTAADLDDIFAGRPIAEQPRQAEPQASIKATGVGIPHLQAWEEVN